MNINNLDSIEAKEIVKGFAGKFVHSGSMTFAYWDIAAGASLPSHSHPHEQVVNMLEGDFELNIDGDVRIIRKGEIVVIPPDAEHSARAITKCRVLDVFSPVREDYR